MVADKGVVKKVFDWVEKCFWNFLVFFNYSDVLILKVNFK
jgi:hypothetical protein